ncbi:MAG: hypothetical protein JW927_04910 [Deltaproteobacteria bacterium]|nr:hypothetical protein [Deltaproteobacteria bacterium]
MKVLFGLGKILFIALLFISFTASCAHVETKENVADVKKVGSITESYLGEVSGIAMSLYREDVFWVLNDSGNSASVYAIREDGKPVGIVNIEGVTNNDWEDIATFEFEGKPYIVIADVGDNFAKRSKCFLFFIEEPDTNKIKMGDPITLKPSWSITFTYEDGPRDCESVAVDTVTGKILLLSKRDTPPVLYELPLTTKTEKNSVAKRVTVIKPLPQKSQGISDFLSMSNMTTAMDISADGLNAVVLTYAGAYLYRKEKDEEWGKAFSGTPVYITLPVMQQSESVCFGKDASTIFVTSEQTEQLPSPLYRVELKK